MSKESFMKKLSLLVLALFAFLLLNAQITDPFANPTILGSGMNLVAKVKINGSDATNQDIITAYVGTQLRAKASLINFESPVSGVGRTFLVQTVTPNETITFKVWDYSEQRIYIANITLGSIPGGTVGSFPNNIYEINADRATYNISGSITLNGSALQGILVNASGSNTTNSFSTYRSLTTNANGYYLIPEINSGSDVTITPQSQIYEFNPEQQIFNNITSNMTQDFTAQIMQTYSVSGFIMYNNSPLANVTVSTGQFQAISDLNGYYVLNLPHNHDYAITATKNGWSFNPASLPIYNLQANTTNNTFIATPWKYMIYGSTGTPQTLINITSSLGNNYPMVTSNDQGDYQVTGIFYNDTITLTPAKAGYTFSPANQTFTNIQANTPFNFIANLINYTVSGTIIENNIPLSNVTINYGSSSTTTNANGQYSVSIPWHTNVTIIPLKIGYKFSPTQVSYNQIEQNQLCNFTATALAQYSVSGYVTKSDNSPLSNCQITIGNATNSTDANGFYSLTIYESDTPLQIIPLKIGYTFSPSVIHHNNLTNNLINQNFTATPANYTVSGSITGTPSVLLTLSGDLNSTNTSDTNNNYSFSNIPFESNITISPTKAHYHFTPASININPVLGNTPNQNFVAELDSYLITINVTHQGNPLDNAQIIYNGNTGFTNAGGVFTFMLGYGSSCSITVSKSGYYFVQNEYIISQIDQVQTLNFITRPPNNYTISGIVSLNQNPMNEVLILSNSGNVFTNNQGQFTLNATEGSEINLVPQKTGYVFTPASKIFSNLNQNQTQDFSGSLKPVIYSGYIYRDNLPLPNIKLKFLSDSTYSNQNGQFSFSAPYFSNLQITPQDPNYTFAPLNYTINSANQDLDNLIFNATDKSYYISGIVSQNGIPVPTIAINSSLGNLDYQTNSQGIYQIPLHYNNSTTLTPISENYVFNPINISIDSIKTDLENINFNAAAKVTNVTFSIPSGIYYTQQNLELSCSTPNAQIYYTTNGTEPTELATPYTQPIILTLATDTIIRAKAYCPNYVPSNTSIAYYHVTGILTPPLSSHISMTYNTAINVTLSAQLGSQIRYTKDGSEPTENDSLYTQPLYINTPLTLKSKAFRINYQSSEVTSRSFDFNHLLTLTLPDTLLINQNDSITINLRNYLHDSVSGTHNYNLNITENEHFNYDIDNLQVRIIPSIDWYGTEFIKINLNWQNLNAISDSTLAIVIPDNYPPVFVSWTPIDTTFIIHPPFQQNFIVNAIDPEDPVFYKWYLNNILQNEENNSFSHLFNSIGNYTVKCEITDLNYTVNRLWNIHSVLNDDALPQVPLSNLLLQNYPNPFNPITTISFSIAQDCPVNLEIYDIKGRLVKDLLHKNLNKGKHNILWDATNNNGKSLPNGIYLYKLKAGNYIATKKALLLK